MSKSPSNSVSRPVVISIAPNGARKTRQDHPNIPITPEELAYEAHASMDQGATMIHLHVRDDACKHSIDTQRYKEATAAIRKEVGERMVIQVTSESCGIFSPEEQMQMVREVKPEAVSIAIRELIPSQEYEQPFAQFLRQTLIEGTIPQYILYSEDDLIKFNELVQRGIITGEKFCLLFVLGRYAQGQRSTPQDLVPFLTTLSKLPIQNNSEWFVCAFGPQEAECMITAALLGGHVRIGFENNHYLADGTQAQNNAALVAQFAHSITACHLSIAESESAKKVILN